MNNVQIFLINNCQYWNCSHSNICKCVMYTYHQTTQGSLKFQLSTSSAFVNIFMYSDVKFMLRSFLFMYLTRLRLNEIDACLINTCNLKHFGWIKLALRMMNQWKLMKCIWAWEDDKWNAKSQWFRWKLCCSWKLSWVYHGWCMEK